jgi:hypothetical protein
MSKQILWVIKEKHTDHIFPTLKAARASTAGCDAWFSGQSVRIIARVVLDKISRKGTHVRRT